DHAGIMTRSDLTLREPWSGLSPARTVRGLEASSFVRARVRDDPRPVGTPPAAGLQARERLGRIRGLDGGMDDRPRPTAQVPAEERVRLRRCRLDGKGESTERLKRILSEKRVLDRSAGIRRALQAGGGEFSWLSE